MEENNQQPLNIPVPPDFVFKYRKNRLQPAQEIMAQAQAMFIFTGMKYPALAYKSDEWFKEWGIDKTKLNLENTKDQEEMGGQLAYFEGTPYPAKGHPFPQAIYAINFCKRLTRIALNIGGKDLWLSALGFALTSHENKISILSRLLESYTEVCMRVAQPYILEIEFMSRCSREVYYFLLRFLTKIGIKESIAQGFAEVFSAQIEYDNAYRLRVEDGMSVTTKEKVLQNPAKEMKRVIDTIVDREPDSRAENHPTSEKFKHGGIALGWILMIPFYRKAFVECIEESNFENFQLDEADHYHVLLWADYDFLGLPLQERLKMYESMHPEGLPRRVIYKGA